MVSAVTHTTILRYQLVSRAKTASHVGMKGIPVLMGNANGQLQKHVWEHHDVDNIPEIQQ
jgi:hypothetical protein